MTNPGLDNRLRQHSRRAGFIIGISMALTIAVCIGGFAYIYAKVDPLTRDFVNAATLTPTPKVKATSKSSNNNSGSSNSNANANSDAAAVADAPTDTPVPAQPTAKPTNTPQGFNANYRVSSDVRVNLRSGPSVDTDVVTTLDSGTELQYLNKTQDSANPDADGAKSWMNFRTADGEEGWVRSIDVEKIS